MNVLLFGATGMVGQGVLRECLREPGVGRVLAVEPELTGFDACFFCLGVTSAGLSEERYTRLTYDLTLGVARTLAQLNPAMTFVYVSGTGTDSSERGRIMWARVKGRTENALLALPFKAAYIFRPGYIQPLDGIQSRTRWYRVVYAAVAPLYPALKRLFPGAVVTTAQVGRAMLAVARDGFRRPVLETRDINSL